MAESEGAEEQRLQTAGGGGVLLRLEPALAGL